MQMMGWILFVLITVFALVGAAPFGGGALLAVCAFVLSLVTTWRGALLPGALSLVSVLAALALTPVEWMRLKADPAHLVGIATLLLAFAACAYHGRRARAARAKPVG